MKMGAVSYISKKLQALIFGAPWVVVHEFHKPPYGGGNQFLLALIKEWRRQGHIVGQNRVGKFSRAVLFNSFNFNFDELQNVQRRGMRMVHRVDGPVSIYRGKDLDVDEKIHDINRKLADATIFQSRYSLEKHIEMGFVFRNPMIIPNAADPDIFHPAGRFSAPTKHEKVRLISTSWSDNPHKGEDIYSWLDANLDKDRFEYTFVGRCAVTFRNIRHIEPLPSKKLAELLRSHHVFITASQHDPCSNALIEALSCGLPAVYLNSGGHPELVRDGGIGFNRKEAIPDCLDKIISSYREFQSRIALTSLENVAQSYRDVMTGSQ